MRRNEVRRVATASTPAWQYVVGWVRTVFAAQTAAARQWQHDSASLLIPPPQAALCGCAGLCLVSALWSAARTVGSAYGCEPVAFQAHGLRHGATSFHVCASETRRPAGADQFHRSTEFGAPGPDRPVPISQPIGNPTSGRGFPININEQQWSLNGPGSYG